MGDSGVQNLRENGNYEHLTHSVIEALKLCIAGNVRGR